MIPSHKIGQGSESKFLVGHMTTGEQTEMLPDAKQGWSQDDP
jgi:hypothetical protein